LRPPQTLSKSLQMRSWTRQRAFADAFSLSTFTDVSANASTYAQQCTERICVHLRMHSRKRSRLHISAAMPVHTIVSYYSPRRTAGSKRGRKGESSWLSHRCIERQVGQCGSWNLTCAHCQHQAIATKAYNRASAISWLSRWTPVSFVTSGKLAGWSVHVYNTHPTLRGN